MLKLKETKPTQNSDKARKVNFSFELSSISNEDESDTIINYNNTTSNIYLNKNNIIQSNNNSSFNCNNNNKHSSSLNKPFKSLKILNSSDHLNANCSNNNKTKSFLSNTSNFFFETNYISLNSPL